MDRWKAEQGRGREKRKIRRKKSRRERVRRKKMQMREKVGKFGNTVFFQWFGAPEGRKVGSLKRRVRSQLARWEMKSCTPLWREAHLEVKMLKTPGVRTTFGSCDVEKVHAVVARSTCRSQNAQSTPLSDHFWQLRCWKSARRCGAKHISKSKCTKHLSVGPLLAVEMLKKCTPLWREAHFQVKMYKTPHVRATFGGSDVEKVHAVVARSTFRSQNVKSTRGSDHFWRFRCRFASHHYTTLYTLHCTTHQYITLHYTTLPSTTLHYITLHYTTTTTKTTQRHSTTLHHTPLHYITLQHTTLHYTTLRYLPLHFTTLHSLHSTTLQIQLQLHNYTPLHSTRLHYTKLHYTPVHSTTLHPTTLHYTTLHNTTATTTQLHSTTLHYTPLHYITLHYITLHSTTLHFTSLHYLPLHYTSLHYSTLHSTTLQLQLHNYTHYTPLHSTTLNYTRLHYITLHYTPLHSTTLHYTTLPSTTLHYTH